jgi:hypothetical protein
MMKAKKAALVLATAALALSAQARANVTLLDADGWQFLTGGFAETDLFNDSTRSLTEVVGNTAIVPNGASATLAPSVNGVDGRTFMSIRNSRLDFTILGPDSGNGWKYKGYMEFDLLGYDPQPAQTQAQDAPSTTPSSTVNSEAGYFENPTLRVRHMYAQAENGSWKVLFGQTWDLFGFSPDYVLDTVSLSPVRGDLYERTQQVTVFNTMGNDMMKVDTAASIERPVQDNSEVPGVDAAIRFDFPSWTGAYTSSSSAYTKTVPASLAVSGKVNTFMVPGGNYDGAAAQPDLAQDVSSTSYLTGEAIAVTALIPVIPATSDSFMSSLVLTGEYTNGTGDGDEFSSWTGGFKNFGEQVNTGAPGTAGYIPATPNLDAGQGGYYDNNTFHLMNLSSYNVGLQYCLPSTWSTYINGGYSQLYCDNCGAMDQNTLNLAGAGGTSAANVNAAHNSGVYDLSQGSYVNLFHDFSPSIRAGIEYDRFMTQYVVNQVYAVDNRYQVSAWYRF